MWIITHQSCEDLRSIRCRSLDFREELRGQLKYRFRLLGGDGDVCYEGLMDCNPDQPKTWATEDGPDDPLLDFGRPRAGCCRVQVFTNRHWREFPPT